MSDPDYGTMDAARIDYELEWVRTLLIADALAVAGAHRDGEPILQLTLDLTVAHADLYRALRARQVKLAVEAGQ